MSVSHLTREEYGGWASWWVEGECVRRSYFYPFCGGVVLLSFIDSRPGDWGTIEGGWIIHPRGFGVHDSGFMRMRRT